MSRTLMLTTVGTSLLTNVCASGEERAAIYGLANLPVSALSGEQQALLEALVSRANERLEQGPEAARKASAELNAMLGWADNRESRLGDVHHVLVATDTAAGALAADLLTDYLRKRGAEHVERWQPAGFNTASLEGFRNGIRELLRRCDEVLPAYRALGFSIVFNTLGGFKSQRDVLNIAGMFYADEILYVFEARNSPLLRIPRLPIRIDDRPFREQPAEMLLLAAGRIVGTPEHPVPAWLPESLLDEPERDGRRMLSSWGILVWDRVKDSCLPPRPLPLPRLEYTDRFVREFEALPDGSERLRVRAHETLAEVSLLLEESGGNTQALARHGGLRYSRYSGANAHLGHFRLTNSKGAYRISCEPVPGGLRLRRIGLHDDVNGNP
ncbi:MAG: putative CRISPR-associated protein [Planctomycetota bacterium]|nr:MAG: putative CRISPR-associated protein [Planctomycetota bacterium]